MKQIDLQKFKIDYELLARVPAEFMIKYHFFPLKDNGKSIEIAMIDPENLEEIALIENFTQKKVIAFKSEKRLNEF